jgi:hypothetical protein
MDPDELARRILQAGPGQKWKSFKAATAAPWDLDERNYRRIQAVEPWLAPALFYGKAERQCRQTSLAAEALADCLKPWATAVLAYAPPMDLELLTIHLRILTIHLRILSRTADPGLSDPLIWSVCHLRLGDAWQEIAPRGADRQVARAREHYAEVIRWAPRPLVKGVASNNLACMILKSADMNRPDMALKTLAEAAEWAQKAKTWYDEAPVDEVRSAGFALPYLTAAGVYLAMAKVEYDRGKSEAARQEHLSAAWKEINDASDRVGDDSPLSWPALWWEAHGDAWAAEAEMARESGVIHQYRSNATADYVRAIEFWRWGHPADIARVAQKLGLLYAIRGEARMETLDGRQALGHAEEILRAVASWFTELGYKEHTVITLHDLGIVLGLLGNSQGSLEAHERAVRIIEGLTSSGTVGPAWVVWSSRLADVIDHLLSALARSRHPEIAVARMVVSFGRDADDLAAIRAQPPKSLPPAWVAAKVYEHYLALEYWVRVYDGVDVGVVGTLARSLTAEEKEEKFDSYRSRRRELAARASKLRRRFKRIDDSWKPAAGTPSLDELRGLADRAGAPVIGLHVVADGTVAGAVLPGGRVQATLLKGLTADSLREIVLGSDGWMLRYEDFQKSGFSQESWLKFHLCVDGVLEILGQSLWQPLIQWLAQDSQGYPPSRRDQSSQGDLGPPPLILIPAGPALDILPLSAMSYANPKDHKSRVAADDYRIVHAPTFRLLGHCLDRRDRRAKASERRSCLWFTIPDSQLYWPEATEDYLSRLYPDLHLAEQGSRGEILRRLPTYNISFIDGHARYDDSAPLNSWFELAGGRTLRLFKVAEMNLAGVELLGHLGCETTLSAWNNHASGMAGFAGSILAAGVGALIGSLWCREHTVVSALLNCRLYKELAQQVGPLAPGLALWRAASWLRTASLNELENSVADLTNSRNEEEQKEAIDKLHATIAEDFDDFPDRAPLRRPRHWAGLIAYGSG